MNAPAGIQHYRQVFDDQHQRLPGHDSPRVRTEREQALMRFEASGFPTLKDEDWKYTSVRAIEETAFEPSQPTCLGLSVEDIEPFLIDDGQGPRLVFVNGVIAPPLCLTDRAVAGCEMASIGELLEQTPQRLESLLFPDPPLHGDGFAELNTALLRDGAYVHLSADIHADLPIQLLFISTGQQQAYVHSLRNVLVLEAGAVASLVETFVSIGEGCYLSNVSEQIVLQAGASLDHYRVQRESPQAFHIARLDISQARDSRCASHAFALGGRLSRTATHCRLHQPGAECRINGLYLPGEGQHSAFQTRASHEAPDCTSNQLYMGVLRGTSRAIYNGQVYVAPGAHGTNARQTNNNLLLSPHAEADSKPQLEIFADDVQCAHGATVGPPDDELVFYFQSRGIDRAQALAMIATGFASELTDAIALPALRARLEAAVSLRLGDSTQPGLTGG